MTEITTELAQRIRKLSSKIVDNLVDCGAADEAAEHQYLEWTLETVSRFVKRELNAKDKQIADAKVLAEVESKGADKAAAEGVEWMKRCHAAEKRIAELENDEVHQRLANAEHQLHMAELAKHNLRAGRIAQFRKRKASERVAEELRQRIAELEVRAEQQPFGYVSEKCANAQGMIKSATWELFRKPTSFGPLEFNVPLYIAPPAPAHPVGFLPENLDRALTVLGVALPVSKEEFNLEAERWMQRLINRVIRLDSELVPPTPAPVTVKLAKDITSASAPEVFEIAAEAERLGLRGTYASYAVGWNARGEADKETLKAAGIKIAEGE